jgi:hypothetical protein
VDSQGFDNNGLHCIWHRPGVTLKSHRSFSSIVQSRHPRTGAGRLHCIRRRPGDTSKLHGSLSSTARSRQPRTGSGRLHCIGRRTGDTSKLHGSLSSTARSRQPRTGAGRLHCIGVVQGTRRSCTAPYRARRGRDSPGRSGSTPLHEASYGGHVEVARLLIEHGGVATAQDRSGSHLASHDEVARLLRVLMGDTSKLQLSTGGRDSQDSTSLHRASSKGTRRSCAAPYRARRGRDSPGQERVDSTA